jgi:multidrug efflux system outer membrane protein
MLLSGCSLIPEYQSPDAPIPATWPKGPAYEGTPIQPVAATSMESALGVDFFRAPQLRRLIEQALTNNRDLRVAVLNVEAARAQYRIQRADQLPGISAEGSAVRQRMPAGIMGPTATTNGQYEAGIGLTAFEVDLFGRVHSLGQQALEQFFATQEARTGAQVMLVAEVANAALTLLADEKLLALTEQTLATRQRSFDLIRRGFEQGIGTQLDVAQAQTVLEAARADRERYVRQVAQDRNALTLLLGAPLEGNALAGLSLGDELIADVPAGLSSGVLLNRPDIREAEHRLKAANANIGAARAAFYPRITLIGSLGTASDDLGDLFSGGTGAWNFMPSLTLPIFDAGRNEANLDTALANRDIAVARYEKTIQTAFRDVADALAARSTLDRQLLAQDRLVAATRQSYELAQARYDRGIDNFLNVLDAQRSLYGAEEEKIGLELFRLTNRVNLYKALGGGNF